MNSFSRTVSSGIGNRLNSASVSRKLSQKEKLFSRLFLLIPLLVVMRLTILVRRRAGSEFASVDGMATLQIGLVFTLLLLLLIAPRLREAWSQCKANAVVFLILYYFVAAGSFLWSAMPLYTIYRAIEFLCLFYAVYLALFYSSNYYAAEKKALTVSLIVILLGIAMHLKSHGFSPSLSALHTNSYSASAAMLFCYCLGEYFSASRKRKKVLRNFGLTAFVFLVIGTSSASFIAALLGVMVVAVFNRNKMLLFFAACGLGTIFITLTPDQIIQIIFPGKSEQIIVSMTGRSWLWEMYYNMIKDRPLLGYGFATSTRLAEHYMTNTHNGFLAVILGTGMLGATFFGAALWKLIKELIVNLRTRWPGSLGCLASLTAGLANNMSISLIGEQWSSTTMVLSCFLALHILLNFHAIKQRKRKRVQRVFKKQQTRRATRTLGNPIIS